MNPMEAFAVNTTPTDLHRISTRPAQATRAQVWLAIPALLLSLVSSAIAQTPPETVPLQWVAHTPDPTVKLHAASDFFARPQPGFPEMSHVNSESLPQIARFANYLDSIGVPVMQGVTPNFEAAFDLYYPTIQRSEFQPSLNFGANPRAEVGKLYILEHDLSHHFAGIPGIRRADLIDPAKARQKIVDILILKEVFATAHSSMDYMPAYFAWRDLASSPAPETFLKYSQGFYSSLKPLTRPDHQALIRHLSQGRPWDYAKLLAKNLSPSSVGIARDAGVPRIGPDFTGKLGKTGDNVATWLAGILFEPLHSYYRDAGHKGFVGYSNSLADLMLQPWYVEWSERFQVGIPLEDLHKRVTGLIEGQIKGELLGDPTPVPRAETERQFILNQISQLGRKLLEVKTMHARLAQAGVAIAASDRQLLTEFYDQTGSMFDRLKADPTATSGVRTEFAALMARAEQELPPARIIPASARVAGATYKAFWHDPMAVAIPRTGLPPNDYAATVLHELDFASDPARHPETKRTWKQKLHDLRYLLVARSDVRTLQKSLVDEYRQDQAAAPGPDLSGTELEPNPYLRDLERFRRAFEFQIGQVAIPALTDVAPLSIEEKHRMEESLARFRQAANQALRALADSYRRNLSGSTNTHTALETETYRYLDRALESIFKAYEKQAPGKADPKAWAEGQQGLAAVNDGLAALYRGDHGQAAPPANATLRARMESLLSSLRSRDALLAKSLRGGQKEIQYAGWQPAGPRDGIYLLMTGHDSPLLGTLAAYDLLKRKLALDEVYWVTSREAYEAQPIREANVIFSGEGGWEAQLAARIRDNPGRKIGIFVAPETATVGLYARPPVSASAHALSLAETLSRDLAGDTRPLQLLMSRSNSVEHLTARNPAPFTVSLAAPEAVPTAAAPTSLQSWKKATRLKAEEFLNTERNPEKMANLTLARRASGTPLPIHSTPRERIGYADWLTGEKLARCQGYLKNVLRNR